MVGVILDITNVCTPTTVKSIVYLHHMGGHGVRRGGGAYAAAMHCLWYHNCATVAQQPSVLFSQDAYLCLCDQSSYRVLVQS